MIYKSLQTMVINIRGSAVTLQMIDSILDKIAAFFLQTCPTYAVKYS
jgi:hypothetical protein